MEKSNRVSLGQGKGGLPKIDLHTEWSDAEIYLHGAHVTKFQRPGEPPLLFLSDESLFESGKPIRGGIPIIFPWFGPREGKAMHGFARTREWKFLSHEEDNGAVTLRFAFPEAPDDFPKFTAEYFVTVGQTLALELKITNQANENFVLENCLHTYFTVGDISAVSVAGLKGAEYLDKVDNFARQKETNDVIKFSGETDRVYLATESATEIRDEQLRRVISIAKEGSRSTVVWNPWIAKAKTMADFGDDEYRRMVCVESGNVAENKLTLAPGETSSLKVRLRARPL